LATATVDADAAASAANAFAAAAAAVAAALAADAASAQGDATANDAANAAATEAAAAAKLASVAKAVANTTAAAYTSAASAAAAVSVAAATIGDNVNHCIELASKMQWVDMFTALDHMKFHVDDTDQVCRPCIAHIGSCTDDTRLARSYKPHGVSLSHTLRRFHTRLACHSSPQSGYTVLHYAAEHGDPDYRQARRVCTSLADDALYQESKEVNHSQATRASWS